MKKLFNTGSSVTIDDYTSIRITGPYSLLKLGPNSALVRCGDYMVLATGDDLTVDTLSEEVAVFTFATIVSCKIYLQEDEEKLYGS